MISQNSARFYKSIAYDHEYEEMANQSENDVGLFYFIFFMYDLNIHAIYIFFLKALPLFF